MEVGTKEVRDDVVLHFNPAHPLLRRVLAAIQDGGLGALGVSRFGDSDNVPRLMIRVSHVPGEFVAHDPTLPLGFARMSSRSAISASIFGQVVDDALAFQCG